MDINSVSTSQLFPGHSSFGSFVIFVFPEQRHGDIPRVRPFFSQVRLGGGIPLASQARVTGLEMVSTTCSSVGPSILGGTGNQEDGNGEIHRKRRPKYFLIDVKVKKRFIEIPHLNQQ